MSEHFNSHNGEEQSKYEFVLQEYAAAASDEQIAAAIKNISDKKVEKNRNKEVLKTIYGCLDLTTLKCTDNAESVLKLTEKVNEFDDKHPDLGNVAAICV